MIGATHDDVAQPLARISAKVIFVGRLPWRPVLRQYQSSRSAVAKAAAITLHCRSVSGSKVAAPPERESVVGIDPAIGVHTARGGHALGVAGELAIARIAI
jgi:hypothetical protein